MARLSYSEIRVKPLCVIRSKIFCLWLLPAQLRVASPAQDLSQQRLSLGFSDADCDHTGCAGTVKGWPGSSRARGAHAAHTGCEAHKCTSAGDAGICRASRQSKRCGRTNSRADYPLSRHVTCGAGVVTDVRNRLARTPVRAERHTMGLIHPCLPEVHAHTQAQPCAPCGAHA